MKTEGVKPPAAGACEPYVADDDFELAGIVVNGEMREFGSPIKVNAGDVVSIIFASQEDAALMVIQAREYQAANELVDTLTEAGLTPLEAFDFLSGNKTEKVN